LNIPWLACAYSPSVLFSAYDPPALGILPFLPRLRWLGPRRLRKLFKFLEWPSRDWFVAIHEQRRRLGLKPLDAHPVFQYTSPHGGLALFPAEFAAPQPDWPAGTHQVGFPLFDDDPERELSVPLRRFLDAGAAPIVFTLGTAVSLMETKFFDIAYRAIRRLDRRAVFVVSRASPFRADDAIANDPRVLVTSYENYPKLFATAAVVVHQGGINTTGLALASSKPQVCVPFANDQFDNGARLARMGAGVNLPARRLSVHRLARALTVAPRRLAESGFGFVASDFDARLREAVAAVLADPAPR